MDEHTNYYVARVDTYGANVTAGPFETRAAAAAVCRRYSGVHVERAPPGSGRGPAGAARPPLAVPDYTIVSAADLREAWAQGRVYRW